MNEIYVMMSFRLDKDDKGYQRMEDGRKFWFSSLERALHYIEIAGKPVPGKENTFYDEPCECRWDYLLIEKVIEGPMSYNEVIGWWKATVKDGHVMEYVKLEKSPVENSEMIYNLTGIG